MDTVYVWTPGRESSVNVLVKGIVGRDDNDDAIPGNESRTTGAGVAALVADSSGNNGLSNSRVSRIYICAHR
jgi:hypothetical protein